MDWLLYLAPATVAALAWMARLPSLRLPLDEDFATFTYIARFHRQGLRWKRDAFLFLFPAWRMQLINLLYRTPERGTLRLRRLLAAQHVFTALAVYAGALVLGGSLPAALAAGALYAVFACAPSLEPESIHFEQGYLPFLLLALTAWVLGPEQYVASALALGLMIVTKATTAVYLPAFALAALWHSGPAAALVYAGIACAPLALALAIDFALGYLDAESRMQMRTRMMSTLKCARLHPLGPRLMADLKRIVCETLPLWLLGLPSLALLVTGPHALLMSAVLLTTGAMLLLQRGYSRNHHLPVLGLLALASGPGLSRLLADVTPLHATLLALAAVATAFTLRRVWPFFTRPLAPATLASYAKFEQMLYLPYLGRVLRRYLRLLKANRIFVWGNFIQIYHDTGCPASDRYLHDCIGPWDDPLQAHYFDAVIGGLIQHPPALLIQTRPSLDLKVLEEITGLKFRLLKVALGRYPLYRLESAGTVTDNPLAWPVADKLAALERLTRGVHSTGIQTLDLHQGRRRTALAECRKMLRLNPQDRDGLFYLAELLAENGNAGAAAELLAGRLAEDPRVPELRVQLARLYLGLGQLERTEALLTAEAQMFGTGGAHQYVSGLYQLASGNPRAALGHFAEAAMALPWVWDIPLHQARTHRDLGDLDAAREAAERVRTGAPGLQNSAFRTQACVLLAGWLPGPAHATLAAYLEADPGNPSLRYAWASALEKDGQTAAARDPFARLAESLPPGDLRAAACFRLAVLTDAEERQKSLLETCLHLNPGHREARRRLQALEVTHART